MGHYHHEALLGDFVSWDSFDEESSSDEEEVWNPFMEFQEGEPDREINILMDPKVEQEEDGLTVTLSDTFERFHPMIYIGTAYSIKHPSIRLLSSPSPWSPSPKSPIQGTGADNKVLWATQKQKWLRMTPLTHPAKKIDQVDSEIKDMG